jgi:hypothetical protein
MDRDQHGAAAPRPYLPLSESLVPAAKSLSVVSLPIRASTQARSGASPCTGRATTGSHASRGGGAVLRVAEECPGPRGLRTTFPSNHGQIGFNPAGTPGSTSRVVQGDHGWRDQAPFGQMTGQDRQLAIPGKRLECWERTEPSSSDWRSKCRAAAAASVGESLSWALTVPKGTTGRASVVDASRWRFTGNSRMRP